MICISFVICLMVNWIYAIAIFTHWKNAITKTELGEMPLQLLNISTHTIVFIYHAIYCHYTMYIHLYVHVDT
jgi:hypothetical protein